MGFGGIQPELPPFKGSYRVFPSAAKNENFEKGDKSEFSAPPLEIKYPLPHSFMRIFFP